MAIVYLAEDLRHHRRRPEAALLPPSAPNGSSARSRSRPSSNIRTSSPGETDGLLYYVMLFMEGESLRE